MKFSPVISEANERIGERHWQVANEDGIYLGTVIVKRRTKTAWFDMALARTNQAELIRIAKFIAEKLDEK